MKKSPKCSLKKGLLIYLSSIKTKLAINFLKKLFALGRKKWLDLKGLRVNMLSALGNNWQIFISKYSNASMMGNDLCAPSAKFLHHGSQSQNFQLAE